MVAENDPKKLAEELLKLLKNAANKGSSTSSTERATADVKEAEAELAARAKNNASLQEYLVLLEKQKELKKQNLDLSLQEQAAMRAAQAQLDEADKKQIKQTESTKKAAAAVKTYEQAVEKANKAIGPFGEAMGASAILVNQLTQGHLALFTTMGGVLDKTVGMAFSISDLNADLAKQTGQVSALSDNFGRLRQDTANNTLSLVDLQKALVGLNSGYQDFAFLGETVQDEVAYLTRNFKDFGASIESTTKAFDFFGTTMNQAPRQAIGTLNRLKDLTRLVGQGIETILKDLDGLRDPLTRYGAAAEGQFIKLKKLARSLGMETQDIFKVAEGFDTFESAAERAMMLNAQFGTRLNSAFIMSLEHNERILAIRGEFQRQGLDVNKMNRREIQMLAGGLQISEERAKRLLDTRKSLHQITKEDEAANKRISDYRGATEKIEIAIQNMLVKNADVMVDFVNGLGNALTKLAEMKDSATAFGRALTGAFTGFLALPFVKFFVNIGKVLSKITGYLGTIGKYIKIVGGVVSSAFAIFFAAKDVLQSLGFFTDSEAEQQQAQKRLAAGAVGGVGGAMMGGPVAAAIGYMTAREAPGLFSPMEEPGATASDPNSLPPGKSTIPVQQGPKLDDFFLIDGVLHAMNEGDMVLGGTNLLGNEGGGLNKGQKIVVKELTMPITLKVGKQEFAMATETALDVIFDPSYLS